MAVVLLSLGLTGAAGRQLPIDAADHAETIMAPSVSVDRRHVEDPYDARALAAALEDITASTRAIEIDPSTPDTVRPPLDPRRLVIAGDTGGLLRVLRRLRRPRVAASIETAWLAGPAGLRGEVQIPSYLRVWGYPTSLEDQIALALSPEVRQLGLVADDSGDVMIGEATMTRWNARPGRAEALWIRAYVDDEQLCDGAVRSLVVSRAGPDELVATVRTKSGLRSRTVRGRALQLACDDALIVSDGIARDQPRSKRTWWCEPEGWLLALPPNGGPHQAR
jgi:hypothetical protein